MSNILLLCTFIKISEDIQYMNLVKHTNAQNYSALNYYFIILPEDKLACVVYLLYVDCSNCCL